MAAEAVTEKKTALYAVARRLAWVLVKVLMPVKYHGLEKIRDRKGPFVLISNHQHALDPVAIACPLREECVFLGKKELGKNPFLIRCLTNLHCILVDRHHTDMEAMRACMKAVRLGKVLVIFPEGTRHHEGQMEQIENGTSLIVLRSKAPLVPIYFDRPLKFFRRTNAFVGDDIPYEDLLESGVNKDSCEALNERMRETFRRMIAENAPKAGQ